MPASFRTACCERSILCRSFNQHVMYDTFVMISSSSSKSFDFCRSPPSVVLPRAALAWSASGAVMVQRATIVCAARSAQTAVCKNSGELQQEAGPTNMRRNSGGMFRFVFRSVSFDFFLLRFKFQDRCLASSILGSLQRYILACQARGNVRYQGCIIEPSV